jgi:hypothetical protein
MESCFEILDGRLSTTINSLSYSRCIGHYTMFILRRRFSHKTKSVILSKTKNVPNQQRVINVYVSKNGSVGGSCCLDTMNVLQLVAVVQ